MHISLIVAVAENGVIGRNGELPWHIPADLKHFKTTTMGKPLIMGRKTFESIGKPLPGRTSIVITRRDDFAPDGAPGGVIIVHSWAAALEAAKPVLKETGENEVMVIGGAEIYALALPQADRLYLTELRTAIDGDTFFPEINRADWRETSRQDHTPEEPDGLAFSFVTLERTA